MTKVRKQKERFMEAYRQKIAGMQTVDLLNEWERVRKTLNPDCIDRKSVSCEASEERTEKEEKSPTPLYKCSECEYHEETRRASGRFVHFCRHPEAGERVPEYQPGHDGAICFGRGGTGEMIVKTSPRWCPKKKRTK